MGGRLVRGGWRGTEGGKPDSGMRALTEPLHICDGPRRVRPALLKREARSRARLSASFLGVRLQACARREHPLPPSSAFSAGCRLGAADGALADGRLPNGGVLWGSNHALDPADHAPSHAADDAANCSADRPGGPVAGGRSLSGASSHAFASATSGMASTARTAAAATRTFCFPAPPSRDLAWLIGGDRLLVEIDAPNVADAVRRRSAEEVVRPKGGKCTGKLVANVTVNRQIVEPLRRVLRRAKRVWKVLVDLNQFPRADLKLQEPAECVREFSADEERRFWQALRPDYHPYRLAPRHQGPPQGGVRRFDEAPGRPRKPRHNGPAQDEEAGPALVSSARHAVAGRRTSARDDPCSWRGCLELGRPARSGSRRAPADHRGRPQQDDGLSDLEQSRSYPGVSADADLKKREKAVTLERLSGKGSPQSTSSQSRCATRLRYAPNQPTTPALASTRHGWRARDRVFGEGDSGPLFSARLAGRLRRSPPRE